MNNIRKCAAMDLSLVRPYVRTVLFFTMIMPAAFAAVNRSLLMGVSFCACFMAMTSGYTFSISEKNAMERLYGILPVSRSEMVFGRYLFVALTGLAAVAFSLIVHPLLLTLLGEHISASDIVEAAAFGLLMFSIYTVFQLPGYFKYGSVKGRLFMYIPTGGILLILLIVHNLLKITGSPDLSEDAGALPLPASFILLLLSIVLSAVIYAVSIAVSVKIVNGKEM